jgi:hypothetical protein
MIALECYSVQDQVSSGPLSSASANFINERNVLYNVAYVMKTLKSEGGFGYTLVRELLFRFLRHPLATDYSTTLLVSRPPYRYTICEDTCTCLHLITCTGARRSLTIGHSVVVFPPWTSTPHYTGPQVSKYSTSAIYLAS